MKVNIKSESRYPLNKRRVRALVKHVIVGVGMTSDVVVSLMVVGDRKMVQLNKQYRNKDGTTDVLSFPYLDAQSSQDAGLFVTPKEEVEVMGDIVISYPQAVKQAAEKGKLVDEEIDFLVEHGMMHLLGKHHG